MGRKSIIPKYIKEDIINKIKERLEPNGIILLLSLTGSRAFGWAADNFDYDIHGIYYKENYWDWVHAGIISRIMDKSYGYDINLYSFYHLVEIDYKYGHFEMLMNISNPFYKHKAINIRQMWRLFPKSKLRYIIHDAKTQINRYLIDGNARSALHAYRIMMIPVHFIRAGEIKHNIFELNEIYDDFHFTQLEKLKTSYITRRDVFNRSVVNKELKNLYSIFEKEISKVPYEELDEDKLYRWASKVEHKIQNGLK